MSTQEEFRPIYGHPDYEISNYGKIISHKRKTPLEMKIYDSSNGYQFVVLDQQNVLVHRAVLMSFDPRENMEFLQVNHKDCNRKNNHLDNLEWCSAQENRNYREEKKHTPKALTIEVEFLDGKKMYFDSMTACANYFGVSRKAISRYLETDNIRSDRKVQAYFRIVGNTYQLNS